MQPSVAGYFAVCQIPAMKKFFEKRSLVKTFLHSRKKLNHGNWNLQMLYGNIRRYINRNTSHRSMLSRFLRLKIEIYWKKCEFVSSHKMSFLLCTKLEKMLSCKNHVCFNPVEIMMQINRS